MNIDQLVGFSESFAVMQNFVALIGESKGFRSIGLTDHDRFGKIRGELDEVRSGYLYPLAMADHVGHSRFIDELADIVILAMDWADFKGEDLGAAIVNKTLYNVTRPYLHGKIVSKPASAEGSNE